MLEVITNTNVDLENLEEVQGEIKRINRLFQSKKRNFSKATNAIKNISTQKINAR